jgi:hypothetical protein
MRCIVYFRRDTCDLAGKQAGCTEAQASGVCWYVRSRHDSPVGPSPAIIYSLAWTGGQLSLPLLTF